MVEGRLSVPFILLTRRFALAHDIFGTLVGSKPQIDGMAHSPERVHSVNFTSATREGFTHVVTASSFPLLGSHEGVETASEPA
jgi:hypothetical protein